MIKSFFSGQVASAQSVTVRALESCEPTACLCDMSPGSETRGMTIGETSGVKSTPAHVTKRVND